MVSRRDILSLLAIATETLLLYLVSLVEGSPHTRCFIRCDIVQKVPAAQRSDETYYSPILSTSVHRKGFSVLEMGIFGSEISPEAELRGCRSARVLHNLKVDFGVRSWWT